MLLAVAFNTVSGSPRLYPGVPENQTRPQRPQQPQAVLQQSSLKYIVKEIK